MVGPHFFPMPTLLLAPKSLEKKVRNILNQQKSITDKYLKFNNKKTMFRKFLENMFLEETEKHNQKLDESRMDVRRELEDLERKSEHKREDLMRKAKETIADYKLGAREVAEQDIANVKARVSKQEEKIDEVKMKLFDAELLVYQATEQYNDLMVRIEDAKENQGQADESWKAIIEEKVAALEIKDKHITSLETIVKNITGKLPDLTGIDVTVKQNNSNN